MLAVKNTSANTGDIRDTASIPGLGISPGEGNGNPFQYSCLENPMGKGAHQSMGLQKVGHDSSNLAQPPSTHCGLGRGLSYFPPALSSVASHGD